MSVWIITKGEYSDYEVLGYFPTEKEAKKYCERLNRFSGRYNEPYEYAELGMIGYIVKGISFYNKHQIYYQKVNGGWKFQADWSYSNVILEKSENTFSLRGDSFSANVITPSFDTAKKIAEDRLYKALFERDL